MEKGLSVKLAEACRGGSDSQYCAEDPSDMQYSEVCGMWTRLLLAVGNDLLMLFN